MKQLLWNLAAIVAICLICLGCGGGGTPQAVSFGDTQIVPATVGTYQGLAGGLNYPLMAFADLEPTGSSQAKLRSSTTTSALTYSAVLGLYVGPPVFSGNSATIPFYTDAAGKNSGGAIVVTAPSLASLSTVYPFYPFTLDVTIDITRGNLPCTGTATLVFEDQKGDGTVVGDLLFTRTGVKLHFSLSIQNGQVGGTATAYADGVTVLVTKISGPNGGTLTGNVAISELGWSGTVQFSVTNGSFQISMNIGTNQVDTATIQSNGQLQISTWNGLVSNIPNPLQAVP